MGRMHRRRPPTPTSAPQRPGFTDINIKATHQATDGMDSTIIKATKPAV